METITLVLKSRTVIGKHVNKLRRNGTVPVHLYGATISSKHLEIDERTLLKVLPKVGRNIPLTVEVEGEDGQNICFVREVQRHPVKESLLHEDFYRVEATQRVVAEVPVILDGEAPAVRNLGGVLIHALSSLHVESLPLRMPSAIHVNITLLDSFDKAIRIKDLVIDPDVKILNDADEMIAKVNPPRIVEVAEVAVEAEGEEAAEGEEGEEAAAEKGEKAEKTEKAEKKE